MSNTETAARAWRHAYATRLNSFRRQPGAPGELPELIRHIGTVPGLSAVELNYPQHLAGVDRADVRTALAEVGLSVTALNLRFEGAEYQNGAFTSPVRSVREQSVCAATAAIDEAVAFGADHVIVWLAEDGFDYPFQVDFAKLWDLALEGLHRVAAHNREVRVSIEYKPRALAASALSDPWAKRCWPPAPSDCRISASHWTSATAS